MAKVRVGTVDIVMASLAIFALALLFISLIFDLTPPQEELFRWIDLGVCAIFITELGFRFHRAPSKRSCMRDSWADILGSIPAAVMEMSIIRAFRLFRVARVARVTRVAKVTKVAKITRAAKATKAAKALKLARKMPKLRKTAKKFRRRKHSR